MHLRMEFDVSLVLRDIVSDLLSQVREQVQYRLSTNRARYMSLDVDGIVAKQILTASNLFSNSPC